jgi:quercetin dioxygenase-like cupin family protein
MIFDTVNVGNFEHAHTDNRRTILECNLPTSSIQYFTITSTLPLGNHFHKERQETFVILKGRGKCVWLSLNGEGRPLSSEQVTADVREGSVIQILPFTAHAFSLEPGSIMLCFSSIRFDLDDQDMFPYKLDV